MIDLKENESICHVCKGYACDDEGEYCIDDSPNLGTIDGCFMFKNLPDQDEEQEDGYEEPDVIFMAVTI